MSGGQGAVGSVGEGGPTMPMGATEGERQWGTLGYPAISSERNYGCKHCPARIGNRKATIVCVEPTS